MTKAIKAIAVVSKSNPRISVKDIYSHHDSLSIRVNEDERKIKVMIVPVKGQQTPKSAPGRIKRGKR